VSCFPELVKIYLSRRDHMARDWGSEMSIVILVFYLFRSLGSGLILGVCAERDGIVA